MYDPRSQNYDAIEHNIRAQRNANEFVYDPYERVTLWKYIRRVLLAVFFTAVVITIVFVYVKDADANSNQLPAVKFRLSTTLGDH